VPFQKLRNWSILITSGRSHKASEVSRFDQTLECADDILIFVHGRRQIWMEGPMSIFTILFAVLLVAWILGLSVFHVAGGFIHILLILAVISLILHFVRGRTSAA
jgi:Family of unknown function (DUF5670)